MKIAQLKIARVQFSKICHAAAWPGPCTFAQFYQFDFSGSGFGSAVIETAAQAGSRYNVNPTLKHNFSSLPVPSLYMYWLLPVAGTGVLVPPRNTPGG